MLLQEVEVEQFPLLVAVDSLLRDLLFLFFGLHLVVVFYCVPRDVSARHADISEVVESQVVAASHDRALDEVDGEVGLRQLDVVAEFSELVLEAAQPLNFLKSLEFAQL